MMFWRITMLLQSLSPKTKDSKMKQLKVTLRRSVIGSTEKQRATVKGLGLRRINHTRFLKNTPANRGMVKKVLHLIDVEEVEVSDS